MTRDEECEECARYVVLYQRDVVTEREKEYGDRMLYDRCKSFFDESRAVKFAASHLPALYVKMLPLDDRDAAQTALSAKPYVVAGEYEGKYCHYSYDGSSNALTTYDVVRCAESELENAINEFSGEANVRRILVGVERSVLRLENILAGMELRTG